MSMHSPGGGPGYEIQRRIALPRNVEFEPWWVGQRITTADELNYSTTATFMRKSLDAGIRDNSPWRLDGMAFWVGRLWCDFHLNVRRLVV